MSETASNGDPNPDAKIYHFPTPEGTDNELLPQPEELENDITRVEFIHSRWLHPSLPPKELPEIIASQRLDNSSSESSAAWSEAISNLVRKSNLFDNYDELVDSPDEESLKILENKLKAIKGGGEEVVELRHAIIVLMDLRAYAAEARLSDKTLAVFEKLTGSQTTS